MKTKYVFYAFGAILAVSGAVAIRAIEASSIPRQPRLSEGRMIVIDKHSFRDLNKNGVLDGYEDWRKSPEDRARDLVSRMTLEEKAGAMMHGTARSRGPMGMIGVGGEYDIEQMQRMIEEAHVTSFITRMQAPPATLAAEHDKLQRLAENSRLGIPFRLSFHPVHRGIFRQCRRSHAGISDSEGCHASWRTSGTGWSWIQ